MIKHIFKRFILEMKLPIQQFNDEMNTGIVHQHMSIRNNIQRNISYVLYEI